MAVDAMRLRCVPSGEGVPSQEVLSAGYRLKMVRPNARAVAAEVIQLQPSRDIAYKPEVGDAVGAPPSAGDAELSVAPRIDRPDPQPARLGLVDLGPKSLLRRSLRHVGTSSIGVGHAPGGYRHAGALQLFSQVDTTITRRPR